MTSKPTVAIDTTEKPIIFTVPNVQKIEAGTKTQTRRVMQLQPGPGNSPSIIEKRYKGCVVAVWPGESEFDYFDCHCIYGAPGGILWVREKTGFNINPNFKHKAERIYPARQSVDPDYPVKWIPSIHMPRIACKTRLIITDVWCEQLAEISDADARAEGQPDAFSFKISWTALHGSKNTWEENPWLWCIKFKKV